jgi:hypothetical protein
VWGFDRKAIYKFAGTRRTLKGLTRRQIEKIKWQARGAIGMLFIAAFIYTIAPLLHILLFKYSILSGALAVIF